MGRERGLRGRLVLVLAVVALVGALLPPRPAQASGLTISPSSSYHTYAMKAYGTGKARLTNDGLRGYRAWRR